MKAVMRFFKRAKKPLFEHGLSQDIKSSSKGPGKEESLQGVWLDFLKHLPILKSQDFMTTKISETKTEDN